MKGKTGAVIRIKDAVHCKANMHARRLIKNQLSYRTARYTKSKYGGRDNVVVKQYLIEGHDKTGGTFLTGLLSRVTKHCEKKGYRLEIKGEDNLEKIRPNKLPKLKGITFRPDQREALKAARYNARGKIIFPTGSGKTIIALGIMSMFPDKRILWLCHTKDLIEQTKAELKKFEFKNVFIIGAGYKANFKKIIKLNQVIVLSTIQSFHKINPAFYGPFFDLTIVDEMHHANRPKNEALYGDVMTHNLSPLRYGLSATEPTTEKEWLVNEGFFGPVIARLSVAEGVEAGIIAKPIVNLIVVPYDIEINQRCKNKYKNFYQLGIVENEIRNKKIVSETFVTMSQHKTTLIIIEREEHGNELQRLFLKQGLTVPFVYGKTQTKRRVHYKKALTKGKIQVIICSKVWREGINIPTLDHVINACGMKEEKLVVQAIGRGLRTTKSKKTVKLTDFLDPYRFLAEHAIRRIQVYAREGWI